MQHVKLVCIGDGGVGKTCTLLTYATQKFPEKYVPTIFDNHQVYAEIDKKKVKLNLWDTAGQEDYDRLRPLSYAKCDVLLIFFSLDNSTSFDNVRTRWIPEARQQTTCPWILVGTKADINPHAISYTEAKELAQELGAADYMMISALLQTNLKELFEKSIRLALTHQCTQRDTLGKRHTYRYSEESCRCTLQ